MKQLVKQAGFLFPSVMLAILFFVLAFAGAVYAQQMSDEQVIKYVIAQLHKDPENRVEDADVPQIVTAELDYEDSLAM